jgi:proline iminopeptidase
MSPVSDGQLYYREFGSGDNILVGLHGGPGAANDYLAPLVDLAGGEWTVYLYDQYGGGRSDTPPERVYDHYTIEEYRDRLDEVREAISEQQLHLYGHSWGGWLALSYVLTYPDQVASLILADTSADIQRAAEAMRETARECLSDEERAEFDELVADRAFDDDTVEEYLEHIKDEHIKDEHINRSDEDPFEFSPPIDPEIYGVMWGPSEFVLAETARLRDWSVTDRLSEIECPTLVINGQYDEISPRLGEEMADKIPDARFVEIEDASHLPLWEDRETHTSVVTEFLDSVR